MARYKTYNYALAKVRVWLKTGKDRLGVSGSRRLGTVEPVFADINHATGLRRFSLRGRRKVNAQWMIYCLAHNIGKIQRYGDIGRWKKERKAEIRQ